jgi:hypothetical protein
MPFAFNIHLCSYELTKITIGIRASTHRDLIESFGITIPNKRERVKHLVSKTLSEEYTKLR